MSNTVIDLMKPRWKVIADYPGAFAIVGSVWAEDEGHHYVGHHEELDEKKYPHLFKKLEWWEDRKEKDMPEYVSYNHGEGTYTTHKQIYKTENEVLYFNELIDDFKIGWLPVEGNFENYFPATESEYNEYMGIKK